MDHLTMLNALNTEINKLDTLQEWIDNARVAAPTNQHVQLTLDRQQEDLNRNREFIELFMIDIRSRN